MGARCGAGIRSLEQLAHSDTVLVEEAIRTSMPFANKPMPVQAASAPPALMLTWSSQQASSLKAAHTRKAQAAKLVAQARDLLRKRQHRGTLCPPSREGAGVGGVSVSDGGGKGASMAMEEGNEREIGVKRAGLGECGDRTEAHEGSERRGFAILDLGASSELLLLASLVSGLCSALKHSFASAIHACFWN